MTKTEKQRIDFSDAKRFKAEYEAYFSALKYFAFRYIEDEEVVCDLLQDLFVKLWERGEMFENEMVLKAYLYRSVRNNCLTYIRDNRRREHRLAEYEPEETEEAFVDRMIEAEVYAWSTRCSRSCRMLAGKFTSEVWKGKATRKFLKSSTLPSIPSKSIKTMPIIICVSGWKNSFALLPGSDNLSYIIR